MPCDHYIDCIINVVMVHTPRRIASHNLANVKEWHDDILLFVHTILNFKQLGTQNSYEIAYISIA